MAGAAIRRHRHFTDAFSVKAISMIEWPIAYAALAQRAWYS
jgi:hypothetical protein